MTADLQCQFCSRRGEKGVRVWGVHMCCNCQDELLEAPVGGERYLYYLRILKEAKESWDFAAENKG